MTKPTGFDILDPPDEPYTLDINPDAISIEVTPELHRFVVSQIFKVFFEEADIYIDVTGPATCELRISSDAGTMDRIIYDFGSVLDAFAPGRLEDRDVMVEMLQRTVDRLMAIQEFDDDPL